jgi:predicted DCC family thiol-disulfide oxidoreductase YuxK
MTAGWSRSPVGSETVGPVIVFDGVCLLCSRWVRFVLTHDGEARYRFASMQSDSGRSLLLAHGLDPDSPQSFLLVEGRQGHTDSDAIARVLLSLRRRRWRCLGRAIGLIPRRLRDPVYRFVARHRYRIFGRSRSCFLPTPEQRARFMP